MEDDIYKLKEDLFDSQNEVKTLQQEFNTYKIFNQIDKINGNQNVMWPFTLFQVSEERRHEHERLCDFRLFPFWFHLYNSVIGLTIHSSITHESDYTLFLTKKKSR